MASVLEMKAALADEQARAIQLAEKSIQAIDVITGTANFYLTILAIFIGLLGLVGVGALYIGAKREARKVAESRVNTYINGEAASAIREAVAAEVGAQLERQAFGLVQPEQPGPNDHKFPKDPKPEGGGG